MAYFIEATAPAPVPVTPANGKTFTLQELQGYVGGYIEALYLATGAIMWLNEDGKRLSLPYNPIADRIAAEHSRMPWSDYIVGNVLIATRAETQNKDEEEEL